MPNTVSTKRNSSTGRNNDSKRGSRSEHMKKFAETLIGIIKQADANGWHKGWKSNSFRGLPKNYRGNNYSGGNSMFLLLMSRLKGYKTPVFLTLRQANQLDSAVKKGERGIPVFKWGFSYHDKDGKKYKEEQVEAMSKEEREAKGIDRHPFVRTYTVYNIDQTTYPEVHKDRYQALLNKYFVDGSLDKQQDTEGMYKDAAVDKMVAENQWVCPITPDELKDAFYSPGNDVVVVPTKSRFKTGETPEDIYTDGMEYYSTMFHEMAHSTGHESRLNRQFAQFGSQTYAKEELIAESTAALLSMTMGYNGKVIKNSGDYLANWQSVLDNKPEDIIKIMSDVSKASDMIIEKLDEQRVALNQAPLKADNLQGLEEELANVKTRGKTLYDLQAQYSRINGQYPASADDERTRQIAKRIRQAEQIITAYNANVEAAYGEKFPFSKQAMTTIIPHTIYSGREQPTLTPQGQNIESATESQLHDDVPWKGISASMPTLEPEKVVKPESREIPVWEAYENERTKTGDFTYHTTAEAYGQSLLAGVEDLLPRVKGTIRVDQWGEETLTAEIEGDNRVFQTRYIPETLSVWLAAVPKKEEHSTMQSTITGRNVDIVAAYIYSSILSQKENQRIDMDYSNGEHQWESFDAVKKATREGKISNEEYAAFWALTSSFGVPKENLSKSAIAFLNHHIKDSEYSGIDFLKGSKEAIGLLETGKVSAEYISTSNKSEEKAKTREAQEHRVVPDRNPLGPADDYDDFSEALAEGLGIEESKESTSENISLSEDSNPQTDVAGVAEHIMETTHVSGAQAEKMAAQIVSEKQAAVNEKKQKTVQARQEAVKKADDARKAEEERRREIEEQRRRDEENKDGGQLAKIALHASLLLGALELAKANKGIWMNKAGKSNAEFLWAKTPITPYNNLMMNLHSDHKGYQTNVYAYFDELKEVGDSVRSNEKALPFNWTRWDYQNIATKEVITKGEYQALSDEEKSLYAKHHTRQTQQIFNIDQTSVTSKQIYGDLIKSAGVRYEELSERGVSNMMNFSEKLKANYPTAMVIMRTSSKYEIDGKDAARAGKILNLPVSNKEIEGKIIKTIGFPLDRIDDYLPKLVQAKQWVVVADSLDSAALVRGVSNEKDVLNKAYSTAKSVAHSAGMGYERVMVLQNAEYDSKADRITVSGMMDKNSGSSRQAAIEKANDIYRAVVAATGSEQRLDRMGRNNLLPKDDIKYEKLVQEISAGVLMARQGLPATLSKDSMRHIGYWQRELRENPQMVGLLEKDVNNAIESIDKHVRKQVVNYKEIRKDLSPKDLFVSPRQLQISTDLAKLPDIESKEIVIVRDKAKGSADVILPEGASLEEDVEISGIRKDRIRIALGHEGITNVRFYNAGGAFGLKEPNDYYQGKTISLDRLKQYELSRHREIDVKAQVVAGTSPRMEVFTHIRDNKGQYAFFFKPENEPSFSVYPNDAHKKLYFDVKGTDRQQEIHNALAQKYYAVAKTHPEIKVDLVMPKAPYVDMSKIERPTITKDKDNPNKKYVMATVNGEFMRQEISKAQWDKMWLADDMSAYKKAVAAVTFGPFLKETAHKSQSAVQQPEQSARHATSQTTQQHDAVKTKSALEKEEANDEKEDSHNLEVSTDAVSEESTKKTTQAVKKSPSIHL